MNERKEAQKLSDGKLRFENNCWYGNYDKNDLYYITFCDKGNKGGNLSLHFLTN